MALIPSNTSPDQQPDPPSSLSLYVITFGLQHLPQATNLSACWKTQLCAEQMWWSTWDLLALVRGHLHPILTLSCDNGSSDSQKM